MRSAPVLLFLASLAACTVDTEGAACTSDATCPAGQRCGHDRTCSLAAAACPAGPICASSVCTGNTLEACVPDQRGLCATLQPPQDCTTHQQCNATTSTCDCRVDRCVAGVDALCAPGGELVACATEAGTGCRHEVAPEPCLQFNECREDLLGGAACVCTQDSTCPGEGPYGAGEGTYCPADPLKLGSCGFTNGCRHATTEDPCGAGQTCGGSYPGAACACPADGPLESQGCGPTPGGTACANQTLLGCAQMVTDSTCNVWKPKQDCADGLECSSAGTGIAACVCTPSVCSGARSFCSSGHEVSCLENGISHCWSEGPPKTCAPGESCVGDAVAGACACPADGTRPGDGCGPTPGVTACAQEALLTCTEKVAGSACHVWSDVPACAPGLVCSPATGTAACACPASPCAGPGSICSASGQEVACVQAANPTCWTEGTATSCDLGETCTGGACACPAAGLAAGQGCGTLDARACSADDLLKCAPNIAGSLCLTWQVEEACGAPGLELACGTTPTGPTTPACVCPPHAASPTTYYADSSAPRRTGLTVNGAQPLLCRFAKVADALGAAVSGDLVKATGFAGTPVVFTEAALTVPAGVALTTTEAPLGTTSYVIEPAASVGTAPLVALRPGASLSGFLVRNTTAIGVGVATSCAAAGDTAAVTVDTVRISGLGVGTAPAPRFSNGLRHAGNCSLVFTGSTVEEANDTGVLIAGVAATTSLNMTGNLIQRNLANVTRYSIGPAPDRSGGGLVFFGALPGSVTFRSNRLLSNVGDQVLVYSSGTLDLSTLACDATSNAIACYTSGVGLSSTAAAVDVAHTLWQSRPPVPGSDYVLEAGAILNGSTQACPRYSGPCPPTP